MCVVGKASCGRIAWIAATAIALPAIGAELPLPMPVKAALPAKAPAPQLYDWTGFYAGAHLGYAWGRSDWTEQQDGLSGSVNMFQRYDAFANTGSWLAGLQAGYDYVLPNRVVVGAVADLSAPSWRSLTSISIGGIGWALNDALMIEGTYGVPSIYIRRSLVDPLEVFQDSQAQVPGSEQISYESGLMESGTGGRETSAWERFRLKVLLDQAC
jgi:hypothetical protein